MADFGKLFPVIKPIVGMLHLAGERFPDKKRRMFEELGVYEKFGVDGVIVENYHCDIGGAIVAGAALSEVQKSRVVRGVNLLGQDIVAMGLAKKIGFGFVQQDAVAGRYERVVSDYGLKDGARATHPELVVLGGVWPKYYTPVAGSVLQTDLAEGMRRCDAIVVTGEGTGLATPTAKVRQFREYIGAFPLIVGAGLTLENVAEQMAIADGGIVGSWFKVDNDTSKEIDPIKVRDFMQAVRQIRGA